MHRGAVLAVRLVEVMVVPAADAGLTMDEDTVRFAARLVGDSYMAQGSEAVRRRQKLARQLVEHRKLPAQGWDAQTLEWFLAETALLDSNNFVGNVGAGEREGRVACDLVRRRHFGLAHGIGRSGDVGAVQPKAAGSSLIYKLTVELVRDLVRRVLGMRHLRGVLVVPMATGMGLALVLQCLRHKRVKEDGATPRYVVWPRIDQATCLKCIQTAGFEPIVVPNKRDGDVVCTDLEAIERAIDEHGAENVLGVLSTTSCFAPRVPDDVEGIARICAARGVAHVINNAYGLQCSKCCHYVDEACRVGRVDAVVQSTDKNLMVPVGGCIITGPDASWIEVTLSKSYAGRASMSPILDVFLTLVSLGSDGYMALRKERISMLGPFQEMLEKLAAKHSERVLVTQKRNTISFALTLDSIVDVGDRSEASGRTLSEFGSMLFTRGVSGARVVAPGMTKTVAAIDFGHYGASFDEYPHAYVTVACAMGVRLEDLGVLNKRLDQTFTDFAKRRAKRAQAA
ncbi:O-phosphoseryl-tRNASec selenium transferase [Hondaea fermentalgiana]|uniref:O-phosphoseryl-tRNA(Sec) selenium transferase n=1 Tax=Hondaea fermentalgiana TaxID=2315210 RepID=A0A2R5GK78_9STRA|nr:O-phosphoseryl-tRNASec selenium transferase [Hondaea fermentalgiana]|eukprot:GBG31312.1 O-phosphoseryl-tRNASec selenium transferase [Hondaea fermentalgiana]